MKISGYFIILFFLVNSCSAQQYKLMEATHTTIFGGVKGARSENFNLVINNNSKLQPKYLLVGNIKIQLYKESKNGKLNLKGIYHPEPEKSIDINGKITDSTANDVFDIDNVYLVSENIKNKKLIKQKINFNKNKDYNNELLLNGEKLPE